MMKNITKTNKITIGTKGKNMDKSMKIPSISNAYKERFFIDSDKLVSTIKIS
jgi:hypothetical protein